MMTAELITDITARIASDFHPLHIILFGSHARGDATMPDSDIDLRAGTISLNIPALFWR